MSCTNNKENKKEVNIMHIEADNPEFIKYIDNISKKLNIKINVVPCPEDANNR